MTSISKEELMSFLSTAAKTQELPYSFEETATGFTMSLDLTDDEYFSTYEVAEAFELTVVLDKQFYGIDFTVRELTDERSLGEIVELPVGEVEPAAPAFDDEWKLYKAKRWLASTIEFKGFKLKPIGKDKATKSARAALVLFAIVFVIGLGAALVAQTSFNADRDTNEISVSDDKKTDEEVLGEFYG